VRGNGKPNARDELIIAALIGGMSQKRAAQEIGCSMSTVHRTVNRYRHLVEDARRDQARVIAQELKDRARYAVSRLEDVMDSANEPIVLGAIRTALAEASRWMEAVELDQRLRAIEERIGARDAPFR